MTAPLIAILDYGIGNLRSAQKALEKAGADARLTSDAGLVASAAGVVLPGVGAFASCRRELDASGLDEVARDAIDRSQPFLGICIGMQLLFDGSQESPEVEGLGMFSGRVKPLSGDVRIPQMQWNELELVDPDDPLFSELGADPWCYFVHGFAVDGDQADTVATVNYGVDIAAVVAKNKVWGTQFHPEKSGTVGQEILRGFLSVAEAS